MPPDAPSNSMLFMLAVLSIIFWFAWLIPEVVFTTHVQWPTQALISGSIPDSGDVSDGGGDVFQLCSYTQC